MHTRLILSLLIVFTLVSFQAWATMDVSTGDMADFCRAHIDITDNTSHEPTGAQLFSSGMCIGYLKGYRDGVDGQDMFHVGGLIYCIPPQTTNGDLAKVFVKWASANPEDMHQAAAVGFARTMADSFPCKL